MFCPKCGKSDQKPETYCRQCGEFLPDINKKITKSASPEDHIKVNAVLNLMTGVVSITLAILLYVFFLGRENTPTIIYITAAFLIAMFAWQVQTFWRTLLLKKHFKRRQIENDAEMPNQTARLDPTKARDLLSQADFSNDIPATVIENTTKKMGEKVNRQSP